MTDPDTDDAEFLFGSVEIQDAAYREERQGSCLRYFVDLPGVLAPDLDVEVGGTVLIVRAERTLPDRRLFLCRLPVPRPYSAEGLELRFDFGVLEVLLRVAEAER